ncbi:solute:sodium symporter family transporter [Erythrobacter sp. SCSIO 43205]|uniref:solute:sodium symporter family transporter n=1 Tax=Erythrobacter sp. SCSIO 43205 TaxID=2779361 RepID=UPI001CA86911|nr:solute:sodium symporter family transporter [Erythrobacter sp. SCSIO 43205]UAB78081.1 solute:sodium symporter family transporter [Erythrobacter sp. SCSIO 43205]
MSEGNLLFTALSCALFMALVGGVSWLKTRGQAHTKDGYFLAGRGLGAAFIAGSLLLTNLSAEQLIGLNGSAYGYNLSSMGWEVTAAVATIAMALIFLPKYLAGAFTTLPQFLGDRFDPVVRRMSVLLFMLGYGLVTIPSVLYSGSVAVLLLFDVPGLTGLTYFEALVVTVITIGVIGAIYSVFGGLRAVAVSDTLNGVGLLIIGVAVPVFGLIALGDGSFGEGLATLTSEHPEKLNAIGDRDAPTPFGTLFTGMIFANLFYWCTNQYVIQRTLGAKSLADGQKGVLLSGFFKVLVPFLMMIPGVIAFHMYGPQGEGGLGTIDEAYPRLIRDVLPFWMSGFFLAVLLGAVFSSFNSLLNSAATLFALDIYGPARGDKVSDAQLVRVAKIASVVIALFSFIVAPLLYFSPEGLWQIIRVFTGFYNIPTVVIVIVGLFTARVPALGAKIVIIFHVIAYGLIRFVFDDVITLHFIHLYAVLFVIEVVIMLACGRLRPRKEAWSFTPRAQVDMTPWAYARPLAVTLFSCVVAVYLLFSSVGVASANGPGVLFVTLIGALVLGNVAYWVRARVRQ